MVIAGVVMTRYRISKLAGLGVRDSKCLSRRRRQILYDKIIEMAQDYHIVRIHPRTIDSNVRNHRLNKLEAKYMAKVIRRLGPDTSYVDSCDVDAKRFGREISEMSNSATVRSYHRADSKFAIVSAASILAKVTRDRAIDRLRKNGEIGSGYPSDKKTIGFVKKYHAKNGSLPTFARASWKPAKRIIESAARVSGNDHHMIDIVGKQVYSLE